MRVFLWIAMQKCLTMVGFEPNLSMQEFSEQTNISWHLYNHITWISWFEGISESQGVIRRTCLILSHLGIDDGLADLVEELHPSLEPRLIYPDRDTCILQGSWRKEKRNTSCHMVRLDITPALSPVSSTQTEIPASSRAATERRRQTLHVTWLD